MYIINNTLNNTEYKWSKYFGFFFITRESPNLNVRNIIKKLNRQEYIRVVILWIYMVAIII